MRRIALWVMMWGLMCSSTWAINGDMGAGTQPLTDGSEDYPWLIEDVNDFDTFASDPAYWASGVHTKLMTDVDLDPNLPDRQTYTQAVISPDGNIDFPDYQGVPFAGVFDGNHFKIVNMTVDTTAMGYTGHGYLGLFGRIEGDCTVVKNLSLEDVVITSGNRSYEVGSLVGRNVKGTITNCYSSGIILAYRRVGGFVGYNESGHITKCTVTGEVYCEDTTGGLTGVNDKGLIRDCCCATNMVMGGYCAGGFIGHNSGSVKDCYATGVVNGRIYVGGLIGENYGSVRDCYADGEIYGSDQDVGGLVGWNASGSITHSYATGSVGGKKYVGGLVGSSHTSETNCYSTGEVSGNDYVGGLIGIKRFGSASNCFWNNETSSQEIAYFLYNADYTYTPVYSTSGIAEGKTTTQMQSQETYLNAGWDFIDEAANGTHQIWQMPDGGGYPVLSRLNGYVPVYLNGEGSQSSPYLIGNVLELGAVYHSSSYAYYQLTDNLDLDGIQWSIPIVPDFYGHFDGQGYTVSHVNITGGSYLGFFEKLEPNAVVGNLTLNPVSIVSTGARVGGIAGLVEQAYIFDCHLIGTVNGADYLGGLAGSNGTSSRIVDCTAAVDVNSLGDNVGGLIGFNNASRITNCHSSGTVSGRHYIGGLVGTNFTDSLIEGSSSACIILDGNQCVGGLAGRNFSDSRIINSHASGNINSGLLYIGGLIGWNKTSDVTDCYSTGSVNGVLLVGGLVGYNQENSVISGSYSTGDVSGRPGSNSGVGGLVGENNLSLVTASFSNGSVSGGNNIGGFVGRNLNESQVAHCYSTGAVSSGLYSYEKIGGFVGDNDSSSISNCCSSGQVLGGATDSNVGGFAGYNIRGSLVSCYSVSPVSGGSFVGGLVGNNAYAGVLTNCYAAGSISGEENVAGLIGCEFVGTLTNNFWDVETTGATIAYNERTSSAPFVYTPVYSIEGMAVGKTTAEMQTQSTFAGWDFVNDWMMLREGEDYPRLAWQEVFAGDIAGLYGANMVDVAYLANYWGLDDCNGLDDCGRADIDGSGDVGLGDLAAVADDWLR